MKLNPRLLCERTIHRYGHAYFCHLQHLHMCPNRLWNQPFMWDYVALYCTCLSRWYLHEQEQEYIHWFVAVINKQMLFWQIMVLRTCQHNMCAPTGTLTRKSHV